MLAWMVKLSISTSFVSNSYIFSIQIKQEMRAEQAFTTLHRYNGKL